MNDQTSYAVCITAIDPMSEENEGLVIKPSSYNPKAPKGHLALNMEPGDLVFMHPEILHWSAANDSTKSRRILLTGYCIYGANRRNYPGSCTNDVLTRGSKIMEKAL